MNEFALAWTIYGLASAGVVAGWWVLTARLGSLLRDLSRMLAIVLLAVPAQVVGYDGYYAPAALVALFEAAFQTNGDPVPAFATLASAVAVGLVVVLLLAALRAWFRRIG